jgi:hypothetical protein
MPSAYHAADPLWQAAPAETELAEVYPPTGRERAFARPRTPPPIPRAHLWLLRQTFRCLGYFASLANISAPVGHPVAGCAGYPEIPSCAWRPGARKEVLLTKDEGTERYEGQLRLLSSLCAGSEVRVTPARGDQEVRSKQEHKSLAYVFVPMIVRPLG